MPTDAPPAGALPADTHAESLGRARVSDDDPLATALLRLVVILLVLLAATACSASAQVITGTIAGRLVDDATGEPVEGAQVTLLPVDADDVVARGISDGDGAFTFEVPLGDYRLKAERIGYATTTSLGFALAVTGTLEVEFRIAARAITMAPIIVSGEGPPGRDLFEERRAAGMGLLLGPQAVDSLRPTQHPGELFAHDRTMRVRWSWGRYADMRMGPIPSVTSHRGTAGDCFHWIVDRTLVAPPKYTMGASSSPWAHPPLADVEPDDLVAVEVYRNWSEVPDDLSDQLRLRDRWERQELNRMNQMRCGVVVVWTEDGW